MKAVNKKLKEWANLLLDTGKRNNLINFRDNNNSVEIVYPDYQKVFTKLTQSTQLEIFDCYDINDDLSDEEKKNELSKEEYINIYSKKIKKVNSILVYNERKDIRKALLNIKRKGKLAIDETGVNVIYAAFGFVHWQDVDTKSWFNAPLLLVPIRMENKNIFDPFSIHEAEDEVIINPTFAFKLEIELKIKLPKYEDQTLDEYFDTIQELIYKLNWTVNKDVKIGSFSFLKINMYHDILDNQDYILSNPNVMALVEGVQVSNNTDINSDNNIKNVNNYEDDFNDIMMLHSVVDADNSQIEAIKFAKSGKSFVLQGPPGTGKSQTITNIIAEMLYDKKTVLFVSEKLAALNVVYEKLKNNSLSDFCLELHSHKANKKDVINELAKTLRSGKVQIKSDGKINNAEKIIWGKKKDLSDLDEYVKEIHKIVSPFQISFYDCVNNLSKYKLQFSDSMHLDRYIKDIIIDLNKVISSSKNNHIDKAKELLNNYLYYAKIFGLNYKDYCFYGLTNFYNTSNNKKELYRKINNVKEELIKLIDFSNRIYKEYNVVLKFVSQFERFEKVINILKDVKYISGEALKKENFDYLYSNRNNLKTNAYTALLSRDRLDEKMNNSIYQLDGDKFYSLVKAKYHNPIKRLFSSEYKEIKVLIETKLKIKANEKEKKLHYKELSAILKDLYLYQTSIDVFNSINKNVYNLLSNAYEGINTDFKELVLELDNIKVIYDYNMFGGIINLDNVCFFEVINKMKKYHEELSESLIKLNNNFDLQDLFNIDIVNFEKINITDILNRMNSYIDNYHNIDDWMSLINLLKDIKDNYLDDYLEYVINNFNIERINDIIPLYNICLYSEIADEIYRNNDLLKKLNRFNHDRIVNEFKEEDKLHFEISKVQIKEELSALRPDLKMIVAGSDVGVILKEAEKKRKQMPIRDLLMLTKSLVQRIKPCFLMSPLSISTFLDKDFNFDCVIFDEASQIFPQDALGAIYRGKQVIIVGDSKQMPPTNFFNASVNFDLSDEDEEDDDSFDASLYESILDLSSSTLPELSLKWHYRSKDESLINFSNTNFYDSSLITFPSTRKKELFGDSYGIEFFHVDGEFDHKTRTNKIEAEKVVDLIFDCIDKYPNNNLGVVAFSISEQALIERIFQNRLKTRADVINNYKYFDELFIKNLETVQGDERDIIIFSIGYGKDNKGKLLHNFGPLARIGGERRLNVAITRAKYYVKVVSSIYSYDIDLSRTNSKGTKLLKDYLAYSENQGDEVINDFDNLSETKEGIKDEICEFVSSIGYKAFKDIGLSESKIDIAITKENEKKNFVIAIELDSDSYKMSKNARDRDRLKEEVLHNMGWMYYRIWTVDWFRNNKNEKKLLKEKIMDAFEKSKNDDFKNYDRNSELNIQKIDFEEVKEEEDFEFQNYELLDLNSNEWKKKLYNNFSKAIFEIISIEGPINMDFLLKRICYIFDRNHVTSFVRNEFLNKMDKNILARIYFDKGFLSTFELKFGSVRFRRQTDKDVRKIDYICDYEIMDAFYEIIKRNYRITKDDLFLYFVKLIGLSRVNNLIEDRLNQVLEGLLYYVKEIKIDNETIRYEF